MEAGASERSTSREAFVWVGAVALWLLLSFRLDADAAGAEQAGFLIGSWISTLALAALIRLVYWLIRRRRVPYLSPWLFVIAAGIGLIFKLGDAGETIKRDEQTIRIVELNRARTHA